MKALSINGHKLHKIQMPLEPFAKGTVSYMQYPKHRIIYEYTENEVVLKIPSKLALELFRKGILSSDKDEKIILSISGRKIGKYNIEDFRYLRDFSDLIKIMFKKINKKLK